MASKSLGNSGAPQASPRHGPCSLFPDPVYPVANRHRLRNQRAFTLVELVIVVVIVGILAALALPTISRQMRDRRANQAAQTIASFYRTARMRALGRGSSVLVRFRRDGTTFTQGGFEVWESVSTPSSDASRCAPTPLRGCLLNQWPTVGGTSTQAQLVSNFNPAERTEYRGVDIAMRTPTDSDDTRQYLDVCFTPIGATYMADNASTLELSRMTQIPIARVSRASTPGYREVLVLPNGATRVKRKVLEEVVPEEDE